MSYEEEQRRSRVVVETPTARREVSRTEVERVPEQRGISTGMVAALIVGAVALTVILFLFLSNNNKPEAVNANVNMTSAPTPAPPSTIIQQPAPQPPQQPVIVQAPPAQTAPAAPSTVVVTPPTTSGTTAGGTTSSSSSSSSISDDATIQSNVDKKLQDNPTLSALGITATVNNGKAVLTGSVTSSALKRQVEQAVRSVSGVRKVDNQLTVSGGSNANSTGTQDATAPPY